MLTALLVATSLQAQTPAPASPPAPPPAATESAAERAAAAAERAAAAAEKAAEASARMAAAVERLSETLGKAPAAGATTPAPDAAAAKPAEPAKLVEWNGKIGLGLISLSGNASTLTFNGTAEAERKTQGWIYSLKARGVYGRTRLQATDTEPERSQVVALGAGVDLRLDRRFTPVISGYLLGGAEADHIESVEARGTGEAGAGVTWWDDKLPDGHASSLRTDLAFRFSRERRYQYFPTALELPDVDLGGPHVGMVFNYALTKETFFTERIEAMPNVLGDARFLVNNLTTLSMGLTDSLAIATNFGLQYDSSPAPGKATTSTALSVNVQINL